MLLHDDLGSDLTQIGRLIEIAERHAETPAALSAQLQQLRQVTDRAKGGMGHLLWALKPECDNLESLVSLIVRYAGEFFEPWDIRLRLDVPEAVPPLVLSTEARYGFFLAMKETFNNIVRHAQATEVRISLALSKAEWKLTIQDNGCSFDPTSKATGNGLYNIRKRIDAFGGNVEFIASRGKGTKVVFVMKC